MSATGPNVEDLLAFHYECLQGMYFSEYQQRQGGALLFSDSIKDPYYNFFAPDSPTTAVAPPEGILDEFARRDRQVAVYVTPLSGALSQSIALTDNPWARDAWLVGDVKSLAREEPTDLSLRTAVVGRERRDSYVAAFAAAYSGNDPSDPYGQLDPAYTASLEASFDVEVAGYDKYYLLTTYDDVPVGVAAMFTAGKLAGVYGVGTVPAHRRAGIGSAMMAHLARIASDDGAGHILLQTEAGSTVQQWYEKLGYRHRFTAPYVLVGTESDV